MQFTGDMEDRCAISFIPVREIERPVGFDSAHAFEFDCIIEWITKHHASNPCTGETIASPDGSVSSVLHPLVVCGRDAHVVSTLKLISEAGPVLSAEEVNYRAIYIFFARAREIILISGDVAAPWRRY